MNIKGLTHIEVLTSPSCPHCPIAVNMVRKVANLPSYVIATETSVATPEGYNKAVSHRLIVVPPIHINDRLAFVGVSQPADTLRQMVISAARA